MACFVVERDCYRLDVFLLLIVLSMVFPDYASMVFRLALFVLLKYWHRWGVSEMASSYTVIELILIRIASSTHACMTSYSSFIFAS